MVTSELDARVEQSLARETPDIMRYLVRRVRSQDHSADLLSECVVIAWRKRGAAPTSDLEFRMWLFGIARNVLSTHRRSQRRGRDAERKLVAEEHRQSELARAKDDDLILAIREAVMALPVKLREPVVLVNWDGFSLDEAAAHLGVNPSTLRSRYATARAQLSASLGAVFDSQTSAEPRR